MLLCVAASIEAVCFDYYVSIARSCQCACQFSRQSGLANRRSRGYSRSASLKQGSRCHERKTRKTMVIVRSPNLTIMQACEVRIAGT